LLATSFGELTGWLQLQVDRREGEMREWNCWKGAVGVLFRAELLATSYNELTG